MGNRGEVGLKCQPNWHLSLLLKTDLSFTDIITNLCAATTLHSVHAAAPRALLPPLCFKTKLFLRLSSLDCTESVALPHRPRSNFTTREIVHIPRCDLRDLHCVAVLRPKSQGEAVGQATSYKSKERGRQSTPKHNFSLPISPDTARFISFLNPFLI